MRVFSKSAIDGKWDVGVSHYSDCVIIENCWYIFRGEFVRCVADKETGFSNRTVTDNDASELHQ